MKDLKIKKLSVVIIATNAYFVLGLRLIRRFIHFYKGNYNVTFHFFSDKNPTVFLPLEIPDKFLVKFHPAHHNRWVDGTNSKFNSINSSNIEEFDSLLYLDADTNIQTDFNDEFLIGDLIGGEHFLNRTSLKNGKGLDRKVGYNSYVPLNTGLPYTYYYGAFFGGTKENIIKMTNQLSKWQKEDQEDNYEPPANDESYINKYFHYNKPYTVKTDDFPFVISDKGGLGNTRKMINTGILEDLIKLNRNNLWDIQSKKLINETT